MQQLLLNISTQRVPSLENFVTARNEEPFELLHRLAARDTSERFVYLWGEKAVGKTHLLKALAQHPPARYLNAESEPDDFVYDPHITLYLLDDCGEFSPEQQVEAFGLYNAARDNNAFIVAAGTVIPQQLALLDDLQSRMSWGLVYRIHGLTDEEKISALEKTAQERGVALAQDVLPYLMTHYPRDMHSLAVMLDALDRYSLQRKRATITLPLLREMMQQSENQNEQSGTF
jgi:DnaA family protein